MISPPASSPRTGILSTPVLLQQVGNEAAVVVTRRENSSVILPKGRLRTEVKPLFSTPKRLSQDFARARLICMRMKRLLAFLIVVASLTAPLAVHAAGDDAAHKLMS